MAVNLKSVGAGVEADSFGGKQAAPVASQNDLAAAVLVLAQSLQFCD
jgi:hypothetical protein